METKVCSRCKEDKPLSGYQVDKRRKGDSKYQQPCSDCRNAYVRAKRRADIANNKLHYCDIKHVAGLEDFTEEYKKFAEAKVLLTKAINNYSPIFVQGTHAGILIGCTKCRHVQPLPDILPGGQLSKIIEAYEEHHKACN